MSHALEYEEEDLFNDTDALDPGQINTARPIAGPSRPRSPPKTSNAPIRPPPAACPTSALPLLKQSVGLSRIRPRLTELRELRVVKPPVLPLVGPISLKQQCMAVIKTNATRIWDVGDVEYHMIKDFIDELPAEQLAEIEENSPHIRKDTDWLWEYFLLTDLPAAHEQCMMRKGEKRTSGWRRMYRKAAEEARERQQNAAERVAERYKEMDRERAEKKIVVLNQVVEPKKGRRSGGSGFGMQKAAAPKPKGIIGRARADAQRARVAMTHASGKFIPPTSRPYTIKPVESSLTRISTEPKSASSLAPKPIAGPRIPAPRSTAVKAVSKAPDDIIPGAYPTSEYHDRRAALPAHLATTQPARSAPVERFRLETKKELHPVRKADVPNFKPPEVKGTKLDFFGGSAPIQTIKRSREETSDPSRTGKMARIGDMTTPRSMSAGSVGTSKAPMSSPETRTGLTGEEANKLKGVLFRSKPKPRAIGR